LPCHRRFGDGCNAGACQRRFGAGEGDLHAIGYCPCPSPAKTKPFCRWRIDLNGREELLFGKAAFASIRRIVALAQTTGKSLLANNVSVDSLADRNRSFQFCRKRKEAPFEPSGKRPTRGRSGYLGNVSSTCHPISSSAGSKKLENQLVIDVPCCTATTITAFNARHWCSEHHGGEGSWWCEPVMCA